MSTRQSSWIGLVNNGSPACRRENTWGFRATTNTAPPRGWRWRWLAALCLAMAVGGPAWGQELGLTGIAPASGPQAGGTTVTITGNLFTGATHVMFGAPGAYNDAPSFQVVDDQHIVAVTPPGTGTVPVGVGYPGMGTWHGGVTFTYLPPGLAGPATNLLVRQGTLFNPGLITAVGATPPYNYTLTAGSLPAGIGLYTFGDSCYFYGTTLAARGSYPVTLFFSDSRGLAFSQSYTLFVWTNQTASATALAASPAPAEFGQTVTLTATVSALGSGGWTPTGKVVFRDNGQLLGNATLSGGQASVSTPALGVGSRTITAEYWGDDYVLPSAGSVAQTTRSPGELAWHPTYNGRYFRMGEDDSGVGSGVGDGQRVTWILDNYHPADAHNPANGLHYFPPDPNPRPTYSSDVAPGARARTGSSWSVRLPGGGFLFDNRKDLVSMPHGYGIEAWVKPVSSDGYGFIAYQGHPAETGWGLIQAGAYFQGMLGNEPSVVIGGAPVTVGQWTHLALVDNGWRRNTRTLYVNGVPVASSQQIGEVAWLYNWTVGQSFVGLVDEVRFFYYDDERGFDPSLLLVYGSPSVTNITPTVGRVSGGTPVTITGDWFRDATNVCFGGVNIPASGFTVVDSKHITLNTPAGTLGTSSVSVSGHGMTSGTVEFTYELGLTGADITWHAAQGVAFNSGFIEANGGVPPYTFTVTSGSLPPNFHPIYLADACYFYGAPAVGGNYYFTLTVTDSRGATGSQDYAVLVSQETAVVTGVSPASGPATGGTAVTLTGSNFTGATNVAFGLVNLTAVDFTVVDASHITLSSPAGNAPSVDVTVTTPWGTSATNDSARFAYHAAPGFSLVTGAVDASFLRQGTPLAAEYYGADCGPLPIGGFVFQNNNARMGSAAEASTGGPAFAPYFGTTAGDTNLALVSNNNVWSSSGFAFTLPTAVGRSYLLRLVFHDNYFTAGGSRQFSVNAGLVSSGVKPWVQYLDLAALGACGTNAVDLVLTLPVLNADGTGVAVEIVPKLTDPLLCAMIWEEVSPAVAGILPASGPPAGGTPITISGSNLIGATNIAFGSVNIPAAGFTVVDASHITLIAPAGQVGTVNVTVATPYGASAVTPAAVFTYHTVPGLSLVTGAAGAGFQRQGTPLAVEYYGIDYGPLAIGGFVFQNYNARMGPNARAYAGDPAFAPHFGATSDDANLALLSNNNVWSSSGFAFTVPTVARHSYLLRLVFHDNYFATGGNRSFSVNACLVSGGAQPWVQNLDLAAQGACGTNAVDVVLTLPVLNADGTGLAVEIVPKLTNPLLCAMIWEEVTPAVVSISPDSGPVTGGMAVTISGTNFTGATNVAFGSVNVPAAGFTVVDASHITLNYPAGSYGPVDVTVTTPWGTSATHAGARFTYRLALAGVSSALSATQGWLFNPGLIGASGGTPPYTYTITAGALPDGIGLYTYLDSCYFYGTTYATAGSYPFTLTVADHLGLTGSQDYVLTVNQPVPAITSVSPTSGPHAGGTAVTLIGSSFTGATNVAFGGVNAPAAGFTVVDDSHITLSSPAGAVGSVDVTVTTPWGTSATHAGARFTYRLALAGVSSALSATQGWLFNPGLIGASGGTPPYTYTITAGALPDGIGLYPYFDSCYFYGVTYATAGSYPFTLAVTDSHGATGSLDYVLMVNQPAPTITDLAPASGQVIGGATVTLTGANFSGATNVAFGSLNIPASGFTVVDASHITLIAPAGQVGPVNVTVATPYGVSAITPGAVFTYHAVPGFSLVTGSADASFQRQGTALAVEYYGMDYGPLAIGGVVFQQNNARMGPNARVYGGDPAFAPQFGASDDDANLALLSNNDVWSSSGFAFTLPTTAGRSYWLRLVFHDNYFATGGNRRFSVNAGLVSGGAQPWVQHLDLAAQGACGTNAVDVVLTLPVLNSDSTGLAVEIVAELTNPLLCAMTWEEVSPAVVSISPDSGPANGGTAVTLTGSNFAGATNIAFGSVNIPASGFTVVDASHITLSSPAAAAGPVDVTVTTPWGTSAANADARFTYDLVLTGVSSALSATQGSLFNPGLIAASGGTSPYTYTITAGTLPGGIGLYTYLYACYFYGTTYATPGSYKVTVTATDSRGATGSQDYTLVVSAYPAVTITTTNATVAYAVTSCTLAGSCNDTVTGWLVWSNALTGLSASLPATAAWTVPGVTLGVGANVLAVTVTNSSGQIASASVTITRHPYNWDSVGDGIPDWWRAQYFGGDGTTTNANSSAASDPDHDGMSNLQEYVANTDPTNATSLFRIAPPTGLAGGSVSVTFTSSANRIYSLEVSAGLRGDWSAVPGQVDIPGTGGELSLSVPNAPGAHFYRVLVHLP